MRGRLKFPCATLALLGAMVSTMGCGNTIEACPTDKDSDISCVWEGPVSFRMDQVSQADGFIFVEGEMKWEPCGMTPGIQIRSYRIDPATTLTQRMDAPANAQPVPIPAKGPIEVGIEGTMRRVVLERNPSTSVLDAKLKIGELVNDENGITAPIEVASVCEG